MQWTDEGIVLGVKRHGETSVIVELMTRGHGRHLGLVRGGTGRMLRPVLQAGNLVSAVWRARLDQHLGQFTVEGIKLRVAALLARSHAVYGVNYLAALCRLLPERDPHPMVVPMIEAVLDHVDDPPVAAALIAHFELQLLTELGFGLELDRCAVTGTEEALDYVSPKSGRAVSQAAAEPWQERLLRLPEFSASPRRWRSLTRGSGGRVRADRPFPRTASVGASRGEPYGTQRIHRCSVEPAYGGRTVRLATTCARRGSGRPCGRPSCPLPISRSAGCRRQRR